MARSNAGPLVPEALYRREVWAVFLLFLVGASVNAGSLPGQLLALPAYLPMLALDAAERVSGISLGDGWDVVLVAVYYALAVAIAAAYVRVRSTDE
ncbi:hypothetical protein [Natronomonas sp. EA1]|uniref:hypothetical protein n=1 Tax=Natronomonas sp. EA1 TaxID=3421655 RepID=UPI003EB69AD2